MEALSPPVASAPAAYAANPTGTPLPLPPAKRNVGVWVTLAILAVIGLAIGGVGLLRAMGKTPNPGVLQAQGTDPNPGLLRVRTDPASGVTQTTVDPRVPVVMPDDIRRYLEHLERTERQRIETTKTQLPQLMARAMRAKMSGTMEVLKSLAGGDDEVIERPPNEEFANDTAEFQATWRQLVDAFNAYPPPAECVPVRNDYDQALRETGAMIGDVFTLLNDSATNPDAAIASLSKMQGTSAGRIDTAAKGADRGVAALCEKYETKKWFDLAGDIGNSGILTQFSGL